MLSFHKLLMIVQVLAILAMSNTSFAITSCFDSLDANRINSGRVQSSFDDDKLLVYIEENARDFNLAEVIKGDIPVTYFGENHGDVGPKRMLVNGMSSLKKAGVTYIGMEMFNSSDQTVLNDYYLDKVSRKLVLNVLKDSWGWSPESYMEVIDAAKAKGIKILALDGRDLFTKVKPEVAEIRFRDQHMAEIISDSIQQNLKTKIVILTGSVHAQCVGSCNSHRTRQSEILAEIGIRSMSFIVDYDNPLPNAVKSLVRRGIEISGKNINSLFLPLPREHGTYDGYIFIDPHPSASGKLTIQENFYKPMGIRGF